MREKIGRLMWWEKVGNWDEKKKGRHGWVREKYWDEKKKKKG